jgi:hypothetical protein
MLQLWTVPSPQKNSPWYPVNRKLGRPHRWASHFAEEINLIALAGIRTPECRPDSNLVTTLSYPGSFCSGRTWSFITTNTTTAHSQQVSNISDTCCVGDWATSRARSATAAERKSVPPGIKHEFLYGRGCTLDATEHVTLPSVPRLDARTV